MCYARGYADPYMLRRRWDRTEPCAASMLARIHFQPPQSSRKNMRQHLQTVEDKSRRATGSSEGCHVSTNAEQTGSSSEHYFKAMI